MLLPEELELIKELMATYRRERMDIVTGAFSLFDRKGRRYDTEKPFWHRHASPAAFIHELQKKTGRLEQVYEADPELFAETPESAAYGESVLEQLEDILNYSVMLHWLLTTGVEQADNLALASPGRIQQAAEALRRVAKLSSPEMQEEHDKGPKIDQAIGDAATQASVEGADRAIMRPKPLQPGGES